MSRGESEVSGSFDEKLENGSALRHDDCAVTDIKAFERIALNADHRERIAVFEPEGARSCDEILENQVSADDAEDQRECGDMRIFSGTLGDGEFTF